MAEIVAEYELEERVGESETTALFKGRHRRLTERYRAVRVPQANSETYPNTLRADALRTVFVQMGEAAVQVAQACDTAASPSECAAVGRIVPIESVRFDPDADIQDHKPYILSEWVAGGSLADRIGQGALPLGTVVSILSGVLEGLAFLHAKNIVHGNLKPGNILLTPGGNPQMTDFGGNVLPKGIPPRLRAVPYLSPEQLEPSDTEHPLDPRSDLFTLTLVLYEMLTGQRPGRLLTPDQLPSRLKPDLPVAFDALVEQGLQTDLNRRFRNAQVMLERLQEASSTREKRRTEAVQAAPSADTSAEAKTPPITVNEPPPAQEAASPPTPERRVGDTRINERDKAEMIWVPGGTFLMGSGDREEESPVHEVTVKGFWLYRFPVTQALYLLFMNANNAVRRPTLWKRGAEHENKPVTGLNWQSACEYARWAGKRLPTEAEWEWAARGPKGLRYPWGESWQPGYANTRESGTQDVVNVTEHLRGASWCNAVDLLGNAFEWCSSLYKPYPYDPHDGREDLRATGPRVLRGGSAVTPADRVTATARTAPNANTTLTSFRLVCDEE